MTIITECSPSENCAETTVSSGVWAPQALAFTAGPEPKAEGTAVNRLSPLQVPLWKECIFWNLYALCFGGLISLKLPFVAMSIMCIVYSSCFCTCFAMI